MPKARLKQKLQQGQMPVLDVNFGPVRSALRDAAKELAGLA